MTRTEAMSLITNLLYSHGYTNGEVKTILKTLDESEIRYMDKECYERGCTCIDVYGSDGAVKVIMKETA